ncbi:MAG: DNA polymerase III subunit chi [Ketobacter sp.]|nr:DNA polymerase III subunit chi [Ketobacter sp.]
MTRVDFYILPEDNTISPLLYTARLVEKAFRRGHEIYVHTGNEDQTQQLSDSLWQRPESILAHSAGNLDAQQTIHVSHHGEPGQHGDVMINLAGVIPPFFSRFERVAEIVPGKPESRSQSRDNFRYYKERGYALKTHNI